MQKPVIAILMPGDMGHAIGRALREHGHDVITCLQGRSRDSQQRADDAGLRCVDTLEQVVQDAGLILSILPPHAAAELARQVSAAMLQCDTRPVYADCNAVAPTTTKKIHDIITSAGANFIDGGIIGPPPGRGAETRLYVSGPVLEPLLALDGKGFKVVAAGDEIGRASALKMVYAGLTKGTWTLHTAVLLAARRLGVGDELMRELETSQSSALASMRATVPFLAADAARWVGEMQEIAGTLAAVGVTSGFHDGAADIFRLLETSELADETRATMDKTRTLEQALAAFAQSLDEQAGP